MGKKWETHRIHGDIQFMVEGSELIGYAKRDLLTVRSPYNPEKEAEFYEPLGGILSSFRLDAGSFAVFLLQHVHQPGLQVAAPAAVHKVVIKFRL